MASPKRVFPNVRILPLHVPGRLLVVAIGTYGVREAERFLDELHAGGGLAEIAAIVAIEFDLDKVEAFRKFLRGLPLPPGTPVIVPASAHFPRGFFHASPRVIDRLREKWEPEIEKIVAEACLRIDGARSRPATCLAFVSPGGHVVPGFYAIQVLKNRYPDAHFRAISVAPREPVLRNDFDQVLDIADLLGRESTLSTFLLTDDLIGYPDDQDHAVAVGLASLFTPFNTHSQTGHNLMADMTPAEGPGYVTIVIGAREVAIRRRKRRLWSGRRFPIVDHEDLTRAVMELGHQTVDASERRTLGAPLGVQGRSEPLTFHVPGRPHEVPFVEEAFTTGLKHDCGRMGRGADWFARHREIHPFFAPFSVAAGVNSALVTAVRFVAINGGSQAVRTAVAADGTVSATGRITEPARLPSPDTDEKKGRKHV